MLTVERVKKGYDVSGLKPIKSSFVTKTLKGEKCGCAISAIVIGEGLATFEEFVEVVRGSSLKAESFLKEKLELSHEEIWDFIAGFDTYNNPVEGWTEMEILGKQCQREVFGE